MREREGAAEFKARIEGLVHRYEAQHLPRRKRKLTTQQIRDMDEGAGLVAVGLHRSAALGDDLSNCFDTETRSITYWEA
jgi:hypothetical protein